MLNRRQTSFPKTPPTSKYRVHSAPPTSEGRIPLSGGRLPPIVKNKSVERGVYMDKPSTPDPEQVRRVLEQRIAQAMSGPSCRLRQQQMSSDEQQQSSKVIGRRRSLIRSAAIGSEEMHLVPVDDEEMAMLRSINRSQYSKGSQEVFSSEALYKHEYEDKSSEDEEMEKQLRTRRKLSMVRQDEQEESNVSIDRSTPVRRESGISNLEDRLSGMRFEKMGSSTKSRDMEDDKSISGLVYDKEFDCYYNPNTDKYYRLKSQSKSGDGLLLQEKEI
uniref:Uncharacterized protein n=1 Tax=Caenorhabditis tropicalis TaxID=1561998 RepID=A0A1I7UDJ5_9PELO